MQGDGFTPPEFPSGTRQNAYGGPPGVPLGAAAGILAGVAALGVVAVFVLGGSSKSPATTLVAQPSVSVGIPGNTPTGTAPAVAPSASATAQASPGSTDTDAGGGATGDPGDVTPTYAYSPEFYVGECVDTSGSGSDFTVTDATCSDASFKIIYAFQNESGNINNDMAQCYTVNGNDSEFENGDSGGGYTLYCLNSLTGDYSPRRAAVDNCLDSSATYEVDCSSSRATWIVIGRLNGTTNTKGCSQFGSYDNSYFWTSSPSFVLCVDKYKR
ncbi:MAG TPA: hypothetical protein VFN97_04355 [Actinospica sp.]|nr:hypothetical protein [Actinospica sp.]